jgi:hypothetical protein
VNFLGGIVKLFRSRIFVDRFDLKNAAKTLPLLLFFGIIGTPKTCSVSANLQTLKDILASQLVVL